MKNSIWLRKFQNKLLYEPGHSISYKTASEDWSTCASAICGELLIELGLNDTSTLVGHFVSSPREREKRDGRDSREDESEGQRRKRNKNESEETEEIKIFPLFSYLLLG